MIINVLINKWLIGVTGADVCLSVVFTLKPAECYRSFRSVFVTRLLVINNAVSQDSVFQELMCSFGFVFINQQVHAANTWLCVCALYPRIIISTLKGKAASGVLDPTSTVLNH